MIENADDSRNRVNAAQERERINDFFQGIMLDIKQAADYGSSQTTCKVSAHNIQYVPDIIEGLESRDYSAEFDENSSMLSISWL